ncbi:hypothetical protein M8818_007328 [Zalaria obscura]|uniref:Uncharacterized protein n=1 Tax=Zalaria obscura TaxID=2024903 RepID=A0ACC3S316_9PEZI
MSPNTFEHRERERDRTSETLTFQREESRQAFLVSNLGPPEKTVQSQDPRTRPSQHQSAAGITLSVLWLEASKAARG